MSFIKLLQGIGDRLGILESVSSPESAPARHIQTRTVSLRALAGEIRSGEVQALADSPSELSVTFNEIYSAAGISGKAEDWTIGKLGQVIASESSNEKSRDDIQKAVLELLQAKSVSVESLIKDAMARDQALDAFEARVSEKMRDRNQACKKRMAEIEAQIDELRDESAKIEASLKVDNEKWHEWKRLKRAHERELAFAASYIVDHPVITTDEEE
jgi:chromosome segregation ATPase